MRDFVCTHGPQPLDTLLQLMADMTGRYVRARNVTVAAAAEPAVRRRIIDSWESFEEFTLALHGMAFEEFDYGGRLRSVPGTFDVGSHERRGAPPGEISARLRSMHEQLVGRCGWHGESADVIARQCARLLVEFFAIHPFADGNGRIGRLLVLFFVESSGRLSLDPWPSAGRGRRKYLWALRYAHRHRARERPTGADPYRGVERVIRTLVVEKAPPVEFAPPPWLQGTD